MGTRIAVVLGAGGATGGAFHAGVLSALEEATGFDARNAELIVGTSAGAMAGALLRGGLPPVDLVARARGIELSREGQRVAEKLGPVPEPPSLRPDWTNGIPGPAEPGALARAFLRPWSARPGALMAEALPEGTHSSEPLSLLLESLFDRGWPEAALWLCAVRLSDAQRVVFGRDALAEATVGRAAAASCAIPAVYAPVKIGGERYGDGGVHSPTNVDLLAEEQLDLVVVSSPMSAAGRSWRLSPDFALRQLCRATLAREVALVRRHRNHVLVFQPTATDQRAMGPNPMDTSRRGDVALQVRASALERLRRRDVRQRFGAVLAG